MSELYSDNFYSYELKKIIHLMIQKDRNQRPNSMDIFQLFMESYIYKYVKNSGLCSVVQCLFNFPNFENFFTNKKIISSIIKDGNNKKIALIMIKVVQSIINNDKIEKNIYDLRKILNEAGIKEKDNEEITPKKALSFIINSLNYELNELNTIKNIESNEYLHKQDIPGEELEKLEEFKNIYKNKFNSFISYNFSGTFKVIRICENNHKNYMFRRYNFISFNWDILYKENGYNEKIISIYKCFEIYNQKIDIFKINKCITCQNCNKYLNHIVVK